MSQASVTTGIVALGTTQITAQPIFQYSGYNQIATCTNVANSVVLPGAVTNQAAALGSSSAIVIGFPIIIRNDGVASCLVFPPSGASIDALGANNAFNLPAGDVATFVARSATQYDVQWLSTTPGLAISAGQTAFASGTQVGATVIPANQNYTLVSVCATALDSMALPRATPLLYTPYIIRNNGVACCAVFPSNTAADNSIIDNLPANTAFLIGANASCTFVCVSRVVNVYQWFSYGYSGSQPFIPLTATPTVLTNNADKATCLVNVATGTYTLPAIATSVGMRITFILGATAVGTLQIINAAAATPVVGVAIGGTNAQLTSRTGAGTLSVRFSTSAVLGDRIDMYCDGTNWHTQGWSSSNTAATSIIFA